MTNEQRAQAAVERLKKEYPQAECSLVATDPLRLLIATRLSAQCTDARVNLVTPALFARFPDAQAFANAEVGEVEALIRTCGLYKTKARDIIAMCRVIHEQLDDRIPDTVEELVRLPGVGRKTANLIVGDVYGKPAVVADTHCIRISGRIGLCEPTKDAAKVENALRAILPPGESNDFCHRLVLHGRAVCTARSPRCEACVLSDICMQAAEKE